jgi:hypothetical protein
LATSVGPNATTKKLRFTGKLKEGRNEAVPEEPEKMEYIQPRMKEA